ncbi:helix-turn-helix domain-containing protein [Brevibacillus laterosporus]|uniref:helix-turn-helix domain-containing protein n=1 Tax=Brevibacillus laterosporus TaxID=1465 RepID=UPI0026569F92|nr:helix-turn-helix transcriptional regulator [Brevibacillus laterosporus]MDN9012817.1 helix-turn-helix transcriptional regulator [Brevibacillus laterosporus]MDO0943908.1 helix-turn-helix transcriptional regulator [Brevibacillus laterosporus]
MIQQIGNTLKRLRLIYGYTAIEMSKELGISTSYLSEIENNKKQPSLELLECYASVLGLKKSSILLLAEQLHEAEQNNKGHEFIRSLMVGLINSMSSDVEEEANE